MELNVVENFKEKFIRNQGSKSRNKLPDVTIRARFFSNCDLIFEVDLIVYDGMMWYFRNFEPIYQPIWQ